MDEKNDPRGKTDEGARMPEGFHADTGEDGSIILVQPVSQDRFLRVFLPLFGLCFVAAGLHILLVAKKAEGCWPLGFGLLMAWFGFYLWIGKVELRLGPQALEWTRIYLRRWSTKVLERSRIGGVGSAVGVRTNGRPTSWTLHLILAPLPGQAASKWPKRKQIPGFYSETAVLWLGEILATWSQTPFDRTLDRSIDNS